MSMTDTWQDQQRAEREEVMATVDELELGFDPFTAPTVDAEEVMDELRELEKRIDVKLEYLEAKLGQVAQQADRRKTTRLVQIDRRLASEPKGVQDVVAQALEEEQEVHTRLQRGAFYDARHAETEEPWTYEQYKRECETQGTIG